MWYGDTTSARPDIRSLLQCVVTGFKSDCLDNPENAVLVVIDVLDELIDEPGLELLRDALAGSAPFNPAAVKWSRARDSFTKEYL